MNIAICDRYDTDITRISVSSWTPILRIICSIMHIIRSRYLYFNRRLLASPERIFPHFWEFQCQGQQMGIGGC